jgi:plasmid maintenance system antidote protein VapI
MRRSKNVHLLAILRKELDLSQKCVATTIQIHPSSVRNIELGRRQLTRTLAERIGNAYNVDPECLMANNLEKGLRARDGRRWTKTIKDEIQNRLKRWGDLEPYARQAQRGLHAALLYQYLEISHLIRRMPNPGEQLDRWSALYRLAVAALLWAEPDWKHATRGDVRTDAKLEVVLDDIQAIFSEIRVIKRLEKQAKHNRQTRDPKFELKLACAGLFGFDRRGLIAAKLIDEISLSELESLPDFTSVFDLVNERCKKEGIPIPELFDPFKAMQNYLDWAAKC